MFAGLRVLVHLRNHLDTTAVIITVLCFYAVNLSEENNLVMQAPPTDPLYDASHPDESTKKEKFIR